MALALKVSNSLSVLAARLSADLCQFSGSVFLPQFIVTQTTGMNNWLKLQIAADNGITANIRFERPNDLIYQVYFKLDGTREKVLGADSLEWVLFTLLKDPVFTRRFPSIAGYFADNDELKRLALARKMGDLFDQYQIYRPEIIQAWNKDGEYEEKDAWQRWLWLKAKEKLESSMSDKTVVMEYIREALDDPDKSNKLAERMPAIHLFGLSILTAFHIDLFRRLGEHLEVHFYILNPSPGQYWYEDRSPAQIARWTQAQQQRPKASGYAPPIQGNSLLTNWGRVVQDTFGLFFEHEEFMNNYIDLDVKEPATGTLLGKIQHDLFENAVNGDRLPLTPADLQDGSLLINACHTPAREVEVLYNYLVRLIDTAKEPYSARDIVVLVNDVDAYAPYIKAVFGSAPYRIPFTIADESYQEVNGFFSTLQAVMDLREDQFRAENVLQLLELPFIKLRFRISDARLIRKMVDAANIRLGIEGEKSNDSVYMSWVNGLNRIIYGICMQGEESYELDGDHLYPLDRVEGEQALELIRFSHFVQVLISIVQQQRHPATLKNWSVYLAESVAQLMYEPAGEADPDYELFLKQLERLNLLAELVEEPISFDVFRQHYIQTLAGETRAGNFMSGGVTFCSLIPMRSIPFRAVCLLGLNYDKFPRKEMKLSFNIMERRRMKGDRNVKENDKNLFLETLLSAGDNLYISYVGRNQKDNSLLPPSALVDELIDYVAEGLGAIDVGAVNALIKTHPLHGFSRKYADTGGGLYTYLGEEVTGKAAKVVREVTDREFDFNEISLESFVAFFKNPFKLYYNKVLGIYYNEEDVLLADTEVFELNNLQQWQLKQDLLLIPDGDLPEYRDKSVRTGQLPLSRMSDIVIKQTHTDVMPAKLLVERCIAGNEESVVSINLEIDGTVISGILNRIFGGKLLITSFSKKDTKYHLECWLRHLIATAAGTPVATHYIAGRTAKQAIIPADHVTQDQAIAYLRQLVNLYRQGHQTPLLFTPDLDIRADKLAAMDAGAFAAHLNKSIGGEYGLQDTYLCKEYDNGYLDDPETVDKWRENFAVILGPVMKIFNSDT